MENDSPSAAMGSLATSTRAVAVEEGLVVADKEMSDYSAFNTSSTSYAGSAEGESGSRQVPDSSEIEWCSRETSVWIYLSFQSGAHL